MYIIIIDTGITIEGLERLCRYYRLLYKVSVYTTDNYIHI